MATHNQRIAKLLIGPETDKEINECKPKHRLRHIENEDIVEKFHLMCRSAVLNSHWWIATGVLPNYAHCNCSKPQFTFAVATDTGWDTMMRRFPNGIEAFLRLVCANAITDHWSWVEEVRLAGQSKVANVRDQLLETDGEQKGRVSAEGYRILSKVKSVPFRISASDEQSEWSMKRLKSLTSKAGLAVLEKIADNVDYERVEVITQMKAFKGN
jgi:hypothetical protein